MRKEIIEFQGIVYARYPEAKSPSLHRYYYAYNSDRKRLKALHQAIWEAAHGPIPAGHEVHHADNDPSNNSLDNLECLTPKQHRGRHAAPANEKQLAHLGRVRPKAAEWHHSPEGLEWHRQHGIECMAQRERETVVCGYCGKEFARLWNTGKTPFCSNSCYDRWHYTAKTFHVDRSCLICGKEFSTRKKDDYKTCSRKCGAALRVHLGIQGGRRTTK